MFSWCCWNITEGVGRATCTVQTVPPVPAAAVGGQFEPWVPCTHLSSRHETFSLPPLSPLDPDHSYATSLPRSLCFTPVTSVCAPLPSQLPSLSSALVLAQFLGRLLQYPACPLLSLCLWSSVALAINGKASETQWQALLSDLCSSASLPTLSQMLAPDAFPHPYISLPSLSG